MLIPTGSIPFPGPNPSMIRIQRNLKTLPLKNCTYVDVCVSSQKTEGQLYVSKTVYDKRMLDFCRKNRLGCCWWQQFLGEKHGKEALEKAKKEGAAERDYGNTDSKDIPPFI